MSELDTGGSNLYLLAFNRSHKHATQYLIWGPTISRIPKTFFQKVLQIRKAGVNSFPFCTARP